MIYAGSVAAHVGEFGMEVARNWNRVADIAEDESWEFSEEARIALAGYKRTLAAPLFAGGREFYKMALDGRPSDDLHQRAVADAIGIVMLMADQVDDAVDTGQVDESAREAFLYGGGDMLLRGASSYQPENQQQRVGYDIAQAFHRCIIWDDQRGYFQSALGVLIPAALEQFTAATLTEQLRATMGVGEGTFALAGAALLHMLDGMGLPQDSLAAVDEAIRSFGVLAQCLDNASASEAKADRGEGGSRTYLLQYLETHGDTPANLRQAQHDLIDAGLTRYNDARSALSAGQRARLDALRVAVEAAFQASGYRRQHGPTVRLRMGRLTPAFFGRHRSDLETER